MHIHTTRSLMRYFDWPLFLLVIAISLFGVVYHLQRHQHGGLQHTRHGHGNARDSAAELCRAFSSMWIIAGIAAMFVIIYFNYDVYGKYANTIYVANLGLSALYARWSRAPDAAA